MSEEKRFGIQIRETRELLRRMDQQIDMVDRLLAEAETSVRIVRGDFTNSIGMELVWCAPGTFGMGSPDDEKGRQGDETLHQVTLTRGFWIGKYPVTLEQFEEVMKYNPLDTGIDSGLSPVTNITFNEAVDFCISLGERDGRKHRYYLPTEAQWEYACRAGSRTAWCFGDAETALTDYAWFEDNWESFDHEVGENLPNGWGIHDMHGLVFEMCADDYGEYPGSHVTDPEGPSPEYSDGCCVSRGAFFAHCGADDCRSARRSRFEMEERSFTRGFRVVLIDS